MKHLLDESQVEGTATAGPEVLQSENTEPVVALRMHFHPEGNWRPMI
jgi:hypothetical protein